MGPRLKIQKIWFELPPPSSVNTVWFFGHKENGKNIICLHIRKVTAIDSGRFFPWVLGRLGHQPSSSVASPRLRFPLQLPGAKSQRWFCKERDTMSCHICWEPMSCNHKNRQIMANLITWAVANLITWAEIWLVFFWLAMMAGLRGKSSQKRRNSLKCPRFPAPGFEALLASPGRSHPFWKKGFKWKEVSMVSSFNPEWHLHCCVLLWRVLFYLLLFRLQQQI